MLFVGRAIRSGSHFIDWRDTWGPNLIGEGFPHKSLPQKSHESNDQYLRSLAARGEHMFRIWTYTWLPPTPAKQNLYSCAKLGARREYVCSNMSPDTDKICGRDRSRVCVQERSGCDVPGQEVEQLVLARDSTQQFLLGFFLFSGGKEEGDTGAKFPPLSQRLTCEYLLQT